MLTLFDILLRGQDTSTSSSQSSTQTTTAPAKAPAPPKADSSTASEAQPASDNAEWGESFWNRFWLSAQGNFIRQQDTSFPAKYSGQNSFSAEAAHATSSVETLYTGFRITRNLEFLFDLESAGGAGLSNALGIAGFPNIDVVRNPSLGATPYISRMMLHYTLALSKKTVAITRNPLSLAPVVPARRLEFRLGKMSTVDFFDLNSVGSDSHLQFMNWAVVNNGAYDYAADTRGYTYGLVVEYYDKNWAARYGEMLMPTVANGITLDWNLKRAGGQNFELEYHPALIHNRQTVVRGLVYVNRADMGNYREAIQGFVSGVNATPDITLSRQPGRVKYGFGYNMEQELSNDWRAFGRLGWNDGRNESFAYTEIDRTVAFGSDYSGRAWHRPQDKVGTAFVVNGLSGDHRRYLALGGLGFLLGDGALTYGTERILETYYTANVWRGISLAFDYQHVTNPGYNQARGPVDVFSIRVHAEGAVPFDKFAAK